MEDGQAFRPSPRWLYAGMVAGGVRVPDLDLVVDLGDLGEDVGRQREVVDRVARAVVGDAEGESAARELALHDVLDRRVRRDVDLLQGAGDDRRVGVLLVGVHPDAVHARLARGLQGTEAAASGDLEHHVRAGVDLVLRDGFALRRVGEIVRVADQDLDAWVLHLGGPLVAGDVVVDRGDAHAAHRADHTLVLLVLALLLHHAGDDAHQRSRVLLLEEERDDVRVLEVFAVGVGARRCR